MDSSRDILIVGGGLNGATLALGLARGGFAVTVIDAQPAEAQEDPEFDGRAYALALASVRLLRNLGVWGRVAGQSQPMLDIRVSDGHAGQGGGMFDLHFDHAEIEEGPMGHMLEDRFLRRALLQAMAETPGITHRTGQSVTAQETDAQGVRLTLASGEVVTGLMVVGCDGRSSGTAARAGIRRTGWGYGQTALVAAIAHEQPHGGVAHQFFMPAGPLAILPLPGNRSSIVWSETEATARSFMAMSDEDFLSALRPRFGDFLGTIRLEGRRYSYPLGLSLAQSFIAPRLALVGDAAHGLHPVAGQGLNAGLRDIAALAEVLSHAARRGEDPGAPDVLERYQQWRRFDTAGLAMATDLSNRLFSNDNPLLRIGRDIGMGAIGALPRLRRGFIREAAGLTGDLPELMK